MFEDLLSAWDGEETVARYDQQLGVWMFVCVHSTALGPAMGGTRMRSYASPHDALADGLRLASAMTLKQAAAELPFGGGKAVLAVRDVPTAEARRLLLLRYAALVDALGGTYVTAADMNTGEADMDVIGERSAHVFGRSREQGGAGDPAAGTAEGVFHGIKAAVDHVFGSSDLARVKVLVQGLGAVGDRLVDRLAAAGAELSVADVDRVKVEATARRTGATVVHPDRVIGAPCDVFSPCAGGGILSASSIPRLRCRIVAGAANNQLAEPTDAELIRKAGILYAPDFVINAGGVIHLAGYEALKWSDAEIADHLAAIGARLASLFLRAEEEDLNPDVMARSLAEARIGTVRFTS
jgi:leucine dehydrogenase